MSSTSNKPKTEGSSSGSTGSSPAALELKPLKNVIPIVPAQQVDSSCPPSEEGSPAPSSSPSSTLAEPPDNDELGVENITYVERDA